MSDINFQALVRGAMRRRAMNKKGAAILTPEAEQAAVAPDAGGMPPGGAPMPPDAGGGMPPQGGAPMPPEAGGGMPPQGGQLPPEIMQDQGFIEWLAQQGVMLDQASGQFIDQQSGQPIPPDMIMQAYDAYMQEMQGGAVGGMPPQGGAPMPPEAGGMPPQGGAPMPPDAMGGAPMAPDGGMPPEGGMSPEGGDPTQDELFMQFMQEAMGVQFDPNSGQFIDPASGQPVPEDAVMQAYQAFQQQMQGQGGAPAGGEGGEGVGQAPEGDAMAQMQEQLQSVVDAVVDSRISPVDKKIQALDDKLEKILMMLESMKDTDDQRDKDTRDRDKQLQEDIAADLNPTEKTAAVSAPAPLVMDALKPGVPKVPTPAVPNMFELVVGGRK